MTRAEVDILSSPVYHTRLDMLAMSPACTMNPSKQRHAVQCPYDDGAPQRRVCIFNNLLMFQGRLFYLYTGKNLPALTSNN